MVNRHVSIMCDALTEGEICWSSLELDSSMTEGRRRITDRYWRRNGVAIFEVALTLQGLVGQCCH